MKTREGLTQRMKTREGLTQGRFYPGKIIPRE
jgi:hypothetical protein